MKTTDNYGWIDYKRFRFVRRSLSIKVLLDLYVIEDYRDYVDVSAKSIPYSTFCCVEKDVEHWKKAGIWRTPAIVLECKAVGKPPDWAEIGGQYQLIEGHSRLGYLKAMNCHKLLTCSAHEVFLLTLGQ